MELHCLHLTQLWNNPVIHTAEVGRTLLHPGSSPGIWTANPRQNYSKHLT